MKTASIDPLKIIKHLPSVIANGYYVNSPEVEASPRIASPSQSRPKPEPAKGPEENNQPIGNTADALDLLAQKIKVCINCSLSGHRTKAVVGTGSLRPLVMVIGEMPGLEDDKLGLPFVGAAGQFLDKWLESIGLSRYTNVFIANLVRCKTPENRSPLAEELENCRSYLEQQIQLLKPRALMPIGDQVASYLLGRDQTVSAIRGQAFTFKGVPWMPFYHPSTVLRDPELKRPVWEDLKNFKQSFL